MVLKTMACNSVAGSNPVPSAIFMKGLIMGMLRPVRQGSWWLRSESDDRWNCDGKALVGSFMMPEECKQKIEALKKILGDPPEDLEWGYMKD